ncbi:acyl-CoA synthetase [compost metagenome]
MTDGTTNEEIDGEQIRAWCSKDLPDYKIPSDIRFVEYIPKMPNGKISRQQLGQEDIDVES